MAAYCDGLLGQPSPGESKKARGNRDAKGEAEKKAVPEGKQGGRAPSKGSGNPTGSDGKDRTAAD
ncbi:hypothetical protein [Streptomyces atratus]|uniref:hypothetical protein n=1 Tax=Streptomyces atratus TaxID=1893 RepID=UPI0018E59AE6|nr:hypothetical protein [Streptomyces atratus]